MSGFIPYKPEQKEVRATHAVIDLGRIADNARVFRTLVGPGVRLMAVVKANGYGHGAIMVAKTALGAGADYLGVATVDEGVELRRIGLTPPILVLGPVGSGELATAISSNLELTVGSSRAASELIKATEICSPSEPIKVHLKIDTGMRRFGCMPAEAPEIASEIAKRPRLRLAGTFTHFACADELVETPTIRQQARFEEALTLLSKSGIDPGLRHAANSAATIRSREFDFEMVRIGISLYGIAPSAVIPLPEKIRPAMTIRSRVARVFDLAPGDRISYGGTYEATRRERAALIPIGYADGYRRGLSNQAWVGITGARCPVRGRVCMDQTVVGLSDNLIVDEGDEVVVAGDPGQGAPTLDDLAEMIGTIPYEIAAGIAKRVPRVYIKGSRLVAVEDLKGLRELNPI